MYMWNLNWCNFFKLKIKKIAKLINLKHMNLNYIISKVKFISLWHFWKLFLIQLLYLGFSPNSRYKNKCNTFYIFEIKGIISFNVIMILKYELS
jgi:hypothetical protein